MILSNDEYQELCKNPEHLEDNEWIAFYMFPESTAPAFTNGKELKMMKEVFGKISRDRDNQLLWGKTSTDE